MSDIHGALLSAVINAIQNNDVSVNVEFPDGERTVSASDLISSLAGIELHSTSSAIMIGDLASVGVVTTSINPDGTETILSIGFSSLDTGLNFIETLFHEAIHAWASLNGVFDGTRIDGVNSDHPYVDRAAAALTNALLLENTDILSLFFSAQCRNGNG